MQRRKICASRGEEIGLKAASHPTGTFSRDRVGGGDTGNPSSSGRGPGIVTGRRSPLSVRSIVVPGPGDRHPAAGLEGNEKKVAANRASAVVATRTTDMPRIGLSPKHPCNAPCPDYAKPFDRARSETCGPAAWFHETLVSNFWACDRRAHSCVMRRFRHALLAGGRRNQRGRHALMCGPAILSPLPPVLGRSSWAQPLDRIGCALIFLHGPFRNANISRHSAMRAQCGRSGGGNSFR
jgi:hypothetical protein